MSAPNRLGQLSGDYSRDKLPIQMAFDSIGAALKAGLTVSENFRGRFMDFEVKAPIASAYQLRLDVAKAPAHVSLAGMWRISPTYDAITVSGSCSFTWNRGILTMPWLSGLAGTDTYLVRLFVMEA